MPRTILFDLDGTLTDSGEGIMNCAEMALRHFGITPPGRDAMRSFVGPPLLDSFPKFGVPIDQAEEAVRIYREYYVPEGMFQNYPYPGIEDVLIKLQNDGHNLFVATAKPENMSITILEHFGLSKYFKGIYGAIIDGLPDTKASVIGRILEDYPDARDVILVGDTVTDVKGATVHGVPTVGVSWGYGKVSDMEQAGAVAIVNTMDELYEYLTK